MSLIGLANAAAQIKENEIEKPSFPLRTSSMPIFKRDLNEMLNSSSSNSNSSSNLNNNSNSSPGNNSNVVNNIQSK